MRLTLSMLRCPSSATPETRSIDGGELSIGRGPDNDWVLADPDRHLSKRHCVLAFRAGTWQVADLSANGTFLNNEAEPLGPGAPRRVRDGDRLRFGAFELELQVGPERGADPGFDPGHDRGFGRGPERAAYADTDPFALDPFAPRTVLPDAPPLPDHAPIGLPADFDPLAPDAVDEFPAHVQQDHSPSTSDAFRPAQAMQSLPDDWADDLLPASPAQPGPMASTPPVPVPPAFPAALPATALSDAVLLAAFLRGAGMADRPVADPAATMEQIGQVMRELVSGLRRVLIARAAVKGEFRIEQTMISAHGNNPLKFAADDDDALAALIGGARRTNMTPPAAVADALQDIRLHELASINAMQAAVRALIASLDPAALKQQAEAGLGLAVQRKARAWDAYEALHAQVSRSLMDDFDSVFGKNFARAYEQAEAEIVGRESKS